ncbi:MAG: BrnT family toxin [Edaphobacter sp.]
MEFEWDASKAENNERKHGVTFEFAVGIFEDDARIERLDTDSSSVEERWATTGLIDGMEIYVVYVVRGEAIRLISARRASRYEREEYWNRKV